MKINDITGNSYFPPELLVIAPLLALTKTVVLGLSAGVFFLALMMIIAMSVSLCRPFIASTLRIPALILLIGTWTTVLDIILAANLYELRIEMGIYLPLLAVNSLLFSLSEEYFLRCSFRQSLFIAFRTGMVVLALFLVMGVTRELLVQGTLLGNTALIFKDTDFVIPVFTSVPWAGYTLMDKAAGAFVCLGLIIGAWNFLLPGPGNTLKSPS